MISDLSNVKPAFPVIEDVPLESVQRDRILGRQTIGQSMNLDGPNKKITISEAGKTFLTIDKNGITLNDGATDRVFIGYQLDGF